MTFISSKTKGKISYQRWFWLNLGQNETLFSTTLTPVNFFVKSLRIMATECTLWLNSSFEFVNSKFCQEKSDFLSQLGHFRHFSVLSRIFKRDFEGVRQSIKNRTHARRFLNSGVRVEMTRKIMKRHKLFLPVESIFRLKILKFRISIFQKLMTVDPKEKKTIFGFFFLIPALI